MKRYLLSLCICTLCIIAATSTSQAQSSLAIGVRAGLNLANEHLDPLPSGFTVGSKAGFIGGGQLDYWFNDMWAFSAQLLYDQKGATLTESQTVLGATSTGTAAITLSYLEIPLTVKARFGTGSARPYIFAGPTIGILLSASEHLTAPGTDTTQDIKDQFTSTDIGLVLGAGVLVALNNSTTFFAEAGYAYGLANLADNSKNAPGDPTQTANSRDIRLTVGVLFGQ